MRITVIGGANVDITGVSAGRLRQGDSNPGTVHLSGGGVGRNIAENLRLLGAGVSFITAIGDDDFGEFLRRRITGTGPEDSRLILRRGMGTGLYLALIQPTGELYVAVNDMAAVESIGPADLESLGDYAAASDLVVLDANLLPETLEAAARAAGDVPIMADAVSEGKAGRLLGLLPRLEILKANRAEAAILAGFPLDTEAALGEGCRRLLDTGLRQLYITLGAGGACCASREAVFVLPALPSRMVNVNGAGDAFAAGVAYRYCLGAGSAAENGAFGAACAAITTESDNAVCGTLTRAEVEERAAHMPSRAPLQKKE
ncbi:MAG: carbohydrate kinase family protein [Spirochaetaceae bacterium]|jgi:pseudouridine kinase|nr:carbohydrate kinase family protein [Spirochaetaceae bacterium]